MKQNHKTCKYPKIIWIKNLEKFRRVFPCFWQFFNFHRLIIHYYSEWLNSILISTSSVFLHFSTCAFSFKKISPFHSPSESHQQFCSGCSHCFEGVPLSVPYTVTFKPNTEISLYSSCITTYWLALEKGKHNHHKQPPHSIIWVDKHHSPLLTGTRVKRRTCLVPARPGTMLLVTGQKNAGNLSMNDCLSVKFQKYASLFQVFLWKV